LIDEVVEIVWVVIEEEVILVSLINDHVVAVRHVQPHDLIVYKEMILNVREQILHVLYM
jgi:hypothetical protein